MSENVFNVLQLGRQAGTFAAPGSAVPATFLFPVEAPVNFELDRGSAISKQDRGRNVRNSSGAGYHGVRMASGPISTQVRFEDIMDLLEMHYAGGVVASGTSPKVWLYPFEAEAPTLVPYTCEAGNIDSASSQVRLKSALISQLQLSFASLGVPGASPWMAAADLVGFDREFSALTGSLSPRTGLEVAQGHLTRLYEGTTATAFASLAELANSLKSFSLTTQRNLVPRAYGSGSDAPTSYGFTDQSNATFEATVAISSTAKTDFHDIWNVASPASLGERRWRVKCIGSGVKYMTIDMRAGILAVPFDEADGERLFAVNGELIDDSTLDASHTIEIGNGIAAL